MTKAYKFNRAPKTTLKRNVGYIGETIEQKINRIVNNKEPIKDGAPIVFTDRKDGVLPDYNIRTDRFEVATEAMDKRNKSYIAKRDGNLKTIQGGKTDGEAESIQGTGSDVQPSK